jgi:hypothetical protein
MEIRKPIFIIGSGRSGTTVLYNFLSAHPQVCWFSNYTDRMPKIRFTGLIHRVLDFPIMGRIIKKNIIGAKGTRFTIRPDEAGIIYHEYCGFEYRIKTTEADWDKEVERKFKQLIVWLLSASGKSRFLSKQTANTQRIRLLHHMFEDALFVHLIRDGRAVANSLLRVPWWQDTDIWWMEKKVKEWEDEGGEPIELCARHWMRDVQEILGNKDLFGERYLEIHYEDLVVDVEKVIGKILDFSQLDRDNKYFDQLPKSLPNMNRKWKERLTVEQKSILNKELNPFLVQLGYE